MPYHSQKLILNHSSFLTFFFSFCSYRLQDSVPLPHKAAIEEEVKGDSLTISTSVDGNLGM